MVIGPPLVLPTAPALAIRLASGVPTPFAISNLTSCPPAGFVATPPPVATLRRTRIGRGGGCGLTVGGFDQRPGAAAAQAKMAMSRAKRVNNLSFIFVLNAPNFVRIFWIEISLANIHFAASVCFVMQLLVTYVAFIDQCSLSAASVITNTGIYMHQINIVVVIIVVVCGIFSDKKLCHTFVRFFLYFFFLLKLLFGFRYL